MGLGTIWLVREIYKADNPKDVDYDYDNPWIDFLVLLTILCSFVGGVILFVLLLLAVFF